MGLFDYINCEMPLPETDTPPPSREFQTKDTPDQYMTTYTITSDGRLTWRPYEMEMVPKEDRPYPNDDGILALAGSIRRVERAPEILSDFHGDIHFGTISTRHGRFTGGIWDYRARFTDGVCREIELDEYTPEDPQEL